MIQSKAISVTLGILAMVAVIVLFNNCGGTPTSNPPDSGGSIGISDQARADAATSTANNNADCVSIAPFYWEIGNSASLLVSGSTGDNSVISTTTFSIASSSKWVFGTYAVQKLVGVIDITSMKFLTMSAGYTNFSNTSCIPNTVTTVDECLNTGTNADFTVANDNKFYYNGGHFQKWAVDHSLGPLNKSQLATEYQSQLGADFNFIFGSPQIAGGIATNAEQYAIFLRKILSGQLLMRDHLGENAVCTNPATCATSLASPFAGKNFHYSYGHWVEDDFSVSDGAFSSAGLFGFYPWINANKSLYGIVSRYKLPAPGNDVGSGLASQQCGALIRKAYTTGVAQ